MKLPRRLLPLSGLSLALLAAAAPVRAKGLPVYPDAEAKAHVGQSVGITGQVAEVHQTAKGELLLNFGPPYPRQDFTAVVFSDDRGKFGDLLGLEGKTVTVFGQVTLYRGRPEIILKRPEQLRQQ